jgi:hypothetical protein
LAVDIETLHVHEVTAVSFSTIDHNVHWHTDERKKPKS